MVEDTFDLSYVELFGFDDKKITTLTLDSGLP